MNTLLNISQSMPRKRQVLALAIVATLCSFPFSASAAQTSSSPSPITVAHATSLRNGDAVIGALPMAQQIHIEVALKMRNREGLDALIADNAKKQMARSAPHLMTSAEFLANHAPTQAQAQAVVAYLTSMGFTHVTVAPNRMLVSADGTAWTAGNAFKTRFAQVRTHDGRVAFANTVDAQIPTALGDKVLSIVGLQTVHRPTGFAQRPASDGSVHTQALAGRDPSEFPVAYAASSLPAASGVTVGIISQGDLTQTLTDLATFATGEGYPAVSTQIVNTNGTSSDTTGTPTWDLVSQSLLAMAGGQVGKIVFYNIPAVSNANLTADFNTVVAANVAKVVQVGMGGCEFDAQSDGSAAADDAIFAIAVAQGQTFAVGTGDVGPAICLYPHAGAPSWPASSQYVVAVAGSELIISATGAWKNETTWGDSVHGQSKFEPKPSWQVGHGVPTGLRTTADISFEADPRTGAVVTVNGSPSLLGGTTLSAALFTGSWMRIIEQFPNAGFAGPTLYAAFNSDNTNNRAFHNANFSGGSEDTYRSDYGLGSLVVDQFNDYVSLIFNKPPVAGFGSTANGLTVSFHDVSTDPDNNIASNAWTFGDGGTSTATDPVHTYAAAGTYSVTDTVEDVYGLNNAKTKSVTVVDNGAGGTPVADFTYTTTRTTANFTDASTDGTSTIVSHVWNFGDGNTSTDLNPTHMYGITGTYQAKEKVTDAAGTIANKVRTVKVARLEMFANSGFETGVPGHWSMTDGVLQNNPSLAHSGDWLAVLGGGSGAHTDHVNQIATIPSGLTFGYLQFCLHTTTTETGSAANDNLKVQVYESGALIATLATFSNKNATSGYVFHSLDMSPYFGHTVTVKFIGSNNATLPTTWYLDDVELFSP